TLSSLMYLNNAVFTLTDVLGNEIKKIEFSGKKIIIENAGLAPAIYFYRVTKDAQIISAGKIVAE
ncbi:MAG: hypothetical protein ACXVNR_09130, partial [Bacteroidia bacterium]